jgi:hypothetical protein
MYTIIATNNNKSNIKWNFVYPYRYTQLYNFLIFSLTPLSISCHVLYRHSFIKSTVFPDFFYFFWDIR